MIVLTSTEKLQLVLSAGTADVDVNYNDRTTTAYGPSDSQQTAATNTTNDICTAPASSTSREINGLFVNYKTTGGTVTLQKFNSSGSVTTKLWSGVLLVSENIVYTHGDGLVCLDANGNRKEVTSSIFSSLTVTGNETVGGTLAVTGASTFGVKMAAAYIWNTWNPSDVIGTYTNGSTSAASSFADATYFTQSNSSGTVTLTFVKAGSYVLTLTIGIANANAYLYEDGKVTVGGTATTYRTNGVAMGAGDSVNDLDWKSSETIGVVATAGQTITILPAGRVSAAGTTGQYTIDAGYTAMYCGG